MSENAFGKALPIEELKLPPTLYKYRQFNNVNHENALFKQELYLPSAKEFNDPYDSKIPFRYKPEDLTPDNIYKKCLQLAKANFQGLNETQYQQKAYDMQLSDALNDSYHLEKFDQITFNRLCKDYGIFCLTPDDQNLLMWSYYGDSHKGFCIGYDSNFLVKSGVFGMGGKIVYRNDFPLLPLFLTKDDFPLLNVLFTKWKKWNHEDEYRLVHTYSVGKIIQLPTDSITEIVFGCQLSEKDQIKYLEKILNHLPKAKIFKIELAKDSFGLKKVPVFDEVLFI